MSDFSTNVLIVDDDPAVLFLHKVIIKGGKLHPAPLTFADPEAALTHILDHDSPLSRMLIFLDINMPRLSGWELLDQLESQVNHADVKVIMVTSSLDKSDRVKAKEYRLILDFWEKPLTDENISELIEKIGDWIGG